MEVVGLMVSHAVVAIIIVMFICLIWKSLAELFSRKETIKSIQRVPIHTETPQRDSGEIKASDVSWNAIRTLSGQQSAHEARLAAQSDLERLQRNRDRAWNQMIDRQAMSGLASGVGAIAIGADSVVSTGFMPSNNPLRDKKSKAKINKVFNKKFKSKRSNQNG